jgi:hypothetical protein
MLPVAFFAVSPLIAGVASVVCIVGMPLRALSDRGFLSPVILSLCDRFEVRRIHARGYSTEMVEM